MSVKEKFIINGKNFKPYLRRDEIGKIVDKLAKKIEKDYAGEEVLFLIVLKGSIVFGADLMRRVGLRSSVETIKAKSYGSKLHSAGKVEILETKIELAGKHILVVEDIVDTGRTLKAMLEFLKSKNPASVEAVSLLSKPEQREVEVEIKYVGLEIPPAFVVGYGLDYDEQGRQLPDIYALSE